MDQMDQMEKSATIIAFPKRGRAARWAQFRRAIRRSRANFAAAFVRREATRPVLLEVARDEGPTARQL